MTLTVIKIKSSKLSDFEAIGVGGASIYRTSEQLLTLIEKELGKNTANIFAVPIRDDRNNIVDWYSQTPGDVKEYNALDDVEQFRIWSILDEEFKKITALSDKLSKNSENETAVTYGQLLKGILHFPGASEIFVVGDRPVIIFWSFQNNGEYRKNAVLGAIVPQPPTPIQSSPVAVIELEKATSEIFSPVKPRVEQAAPASQDSNIASSVKHELSSGNIVPPILPVGPSWWQRYGWWIALLALLIIGFPAVLKSCTTDFPLYKVPKAECQPAEKSSCNGVPPAPPPVLDKKALEDNDLTAFEGKWRLITNLVDLQDKKISITFSFDKSGRGSSELFGSSYKCQGAASADIKSNNRFDVSVPPLSCSSSEGFNISIDALVQCSLRNNEKNKADCRLQCKDGPCDATFQRD